jgi:hypothetical protein
METKKEPIDDFVRRNYGVPIKQQEPPKDKVYKINNPNPHDGTSDFISSYEETYEKQNEYINYLSSMR